MKKILSQKFFERPALAVARELLGKNLCKKINGRKACFMITETEAYTGPKDKASHAHRGKTERNAPMFGKAGHWYVYFTYGMHWMLNIVTGPENYPAAVLIRGVFLTTAHFSGHAYPPAGGLLCSRRRAAQGPVKCVSFKKKYLNGPAKLTKFLKINKRFNGKPANRKTSLWVEDHGVKIKNSDIMRAPRIGVDYAKEWAKKPYRLFINLSRPR